MVTATTKKTTVDSFDYLSLDSLFQLFGSIKKERDYLVIRLLYDLGCTQKELVNIRVRDVDFSKSEVSIRKTNARKNLERTSLISEETASRLKEYLRSADLIDKKVSYIFQTSRGTSLTTRRIYQIVEQYAKEFSKNPTPQLIKYSHIVHAYQNDVPIDEIQYQVGLAKQRLAQIFEKIKTEKQGKYKNFFGKIETRT